MLTANWASCVFQECAEHWTQLNSPHLALARWLRAENAAGAAGHVLEVDGAAVGALLVDEKEKVGRLGGLVAQQVVGHADL